MTKDNQVNEVIDLISEMIIKYITDIEKLRDYGKTGKISLLLLFQ